MRERMLVDIRRKHMFWWLLEFQWLVFYEYATELYYEDQQVFRVTPHSWLPPKRNVSKKSKQGSYFPFHMELNTDSELWKEIKSEKYFDLIHVPSHLLLAWELHLNYRLRFGGWLAVRARSEQVIITQWLRQGLEEKPLLPTYEKRVC